MRHLVDHTPSQGDALPLRQCKKAFQTRSGKVGAGQYGLVIPLYNGWEWLVFVDQAVENFSSIILTMCAENASRRSQKSTNSITLTSLFRKNWGQALDLSTSPKQKFSVLLSTIYSQEWFVYHCPHRSTLTSMKLIVTPTGPYYIKWWWRPLIHHTSFTIMRNKN